MIKVLIIEDEHYTREALKAQLQNSAVEAHIVGESESVEEAVLMCKKEKPDLIFLDINLKGGTGFDFLEQVQELQFNLIFITAYEEYVLKALKLGAIDYILKPVDEDELNEALQKVTALEKTRMQDRFSVAKDQFTGRNDRIVLRMQDSFQMVMFEDLMYCAADSNYTKFFLADGRTFIASKPLKDFANQLPENIFYRTHQSYLLNINFVDSYDKTRFLYLKNGDKIPVSIRKRESIISRIFGGF